MNQSIFSSALQDGDFMPPAELVSPPSTNFLNSRGFLWALTLASFLGGTYYGYLFRKAAAPVTTQLMLVDTGSALVARWDGASSEFRALESAQLRVNSGSQQRLLPISKATLQRGEVELELDRHQMADIELIGKGITGRARFVLHDPLDTSLGNTDAESLRQQITDEKELNAQMERRLTTGR